MEQKEDLALQVMPDLLWAGTELSLEIARAAMIGIQASIISGRAAPAEEDKPYLFTQHGNVGIIDIKGSLVNRDSPYNRYFGVTSYADISRALIYAASSPSVEGILLSIDSGGGAVNGVHDTAELIKTIASVKPVYAHGSGTMASAAYWLGSSVGKGNLFVSSTSIHGSIGVITAHMEYTKMLEDMGIKARVMRSGEYKALGHPMEKLSDKGAEQIQAQLDAAYALFAEHAAEMRGVSMTTFEAKMGQGREFMGQQGVVAGLADSVMSYDQVFSFVSSKIDALAKRDDTARTFNRGGNHMSRQALTPQQLAAIAAGVAVPGANAEAGAPAASEQAAEGAPATEAATETQPENETPATEAATPAATPAKAESEIVAFLRTELAASNEKLVKANVDLAAAQTEITGLKAVLPALTKIVAQSVSNMKVALGGAATDLSAMSAEALLAEHASTSAAFTSKFKVGQVSASRGQESEGSTTAAAVDPHWLAKVQATRITPNK